MKVAKGRKIPFEKDFSSKIKNEDNYTECCITCKLTNTTVIHVDDEKFYDKFTIKKPELKYYIKMKLEKRLLY